MSLQPEFEQYDSSINKTISFRKVSFEHDLNMLFVWMHQPHVIPFWNLNIPFTKYKEHLHKSLRDPHQTLRIGYLDGVPMSYWETYWAKDDIVGKHYDVHPWDQGVHLLIGPPSFLGKGYALPLLRTIISRLFQCEKTEKVIAEPDFRNEKMIHIFQKCGFERQKEIDLPDKRALLMYCYRESFFRRWEDAARS
ncbi:MULTISPECIES: GNAT family N-acetyltransferase [Thermoactinomyces]|jgi:acetyl CoA:N6-hydroxylysine acetyl transferase|uniref:Lysine N-acyltransferase MbtK n=1 Tax=Thermoactinomyces daqus TaxID=1329516 RepID=A0A7W1X7V8_9BACL|nr:MULTISPECIES: GNAT family N-acetyltransferase [Thermoactinomyces]MBA4541688.1 acetyltransferase [Thermoactinomyces daqus]MBH8597689.1 acetyltransferase [Thermoactinomyces sp. CICC 10523]MBH8604029.1 acetyltransferase [Thermoactinomyces sp. CICC 10522]MBH8606436.1 acetyltransferase [Thermoactinomyces sp. CICC 10521]